MWGVKEYLCCAWWLFVAVMLTPYILGFIVRFILGDGGDE